MPYDILLAITLSFSICIISLSISWKQNFSINESVVHSSILFIFGSLLYPLLTEFMIVAFSILFGITLSAIERYNAFTKNKASYTIVISYFLVSIVTFLNANTPSANIHELLDEYFFGSIISAKQSSLTPIIISLCLYIGIFFKFKRIIFLSLLTDKLVEKSDKLKLAIINAICNALLCYLIIKISMICGFLITSILSIVPVLILKRKSTNIKHNIIASLATQFISIMVILAYTKQANNSYQMPLIASLTCIAASFMFANLLGNLWSSKKQTKHN